MSPTTTPTTSVSSPMPTICVPKPGLVSGSPENITHTTVQITGANIETIDFDIVQTWIKEGNLDELAIQYLNTDFNDICEQFTDIEYDHTESFTAACVDNFTSISLYIYIGDDFNIDECDACKAPIEGSDDYETYIFELPCVPECISEVPTAAPSIPELEPTASPSSAMPTICVPKAALINTTGSPEDITETTVQITGPKTDTIDFDVVQTWIKEGNLDEFAIQYLNIDFDEVCEQFTAIAYEQTESFTAACVDNFTVISLYIYVGDDFNANECDACNAPIEGSDDYETYVLELPCVPECISEVPTAAPSIPELEPTASPLSAMPTICVPKAELINTTGTPDDITETTVQITGPKTDTIDFDVVQTWIKEGNLDEFAIQYLNTDFNEVCEQFTDIAYEHTESFTAACVDNFTVISLYIYVGDDFSANECDACKAPIEGSDDYETYILELPCVRECISEVPTAAPSIPELEPTASPLSAMPTICVPKAELINTTGTPDDIAETTVQITGPKTDTIDFDVVQTWIKEGNLNEFAIQYLNTDFNEVCEQFTDIAYEHTESFTAACVDNFTSISLFIYVGDDFNIDECNACTASIDGSDDYEAYVLELPCVSECITEVPTAAPTIPELEPTASPSSTMPTICVPKAELINTTGTPEDITETTVQITGPKTDTIDFDVVQTWIKEGNLDEFAIQYLNIDFDEVCEKFTDIAYEHTESFTAACVDNFTSISLFIYVGDDFNIDECNACTASIDGSDDYEAYVLELPCIPECPPVISTIPGSKAETVAPKSNETIPTGDPISIFPEVVPDETPQGDECFTGAKIKSEEKDMWCERDVSVISIEEQETDGASVQFIVKNGYKQEAHVEILYNRGAGETECQNLLVLASGESYDGVLTATCNAITQTAIIEVFVDNESKSHGASGESCKDLGHSTCHVIYEIPCSAGLMCGDQRKLGSLMEHSTTIDGLLTEESKAAVESNDTDDDTPYCVNKDFPCDGDEENMVYVCHYSNRGGYQTFCIPEADSDMMRFYSNDYCGPCEGWNGVNQAGQF
jgi:hypothetical protein